MEANNNAKTLHLAMYPWLAMGHLNAFLQLANKLAQRDHRTSFFVPRNTLLKLSSDNHHPSLITFIPVDIPRVNGLPPGAETSNDIPLQAQPSLMAAMDLTRDTVDSHLAELKPDILLFDYAHWLPELCRKHGAKSVYYLTTFLTGTAYLCTKARNLPFNHCYTEADLAGPPPGFPSPLIRLGAHEATCLAYMCSMPFGGGMTLFERLRVSFEECNAIAVKSCKELEGAYCDYAGVVFQKPVFLAGPVGPEPSASTLDDKVNSWLNGFRAGSVIYCALGSECVLDLIQFQELVLGLEQTGLPFFAALKPPTGYKTVESAFPEGIADKINGRGIINDGWVQQKLILQHQSVGCFVTHCGAGSLTEAIASQCQIVLMPQAVDQFCNARLMSMELKIGVEVEKREEDGFFTRHAIQKAISSVMVDKSDVGEEVRNNHSKLRQVIGCERFKDSYISSFVQNLQQLLE